MNQSLPVRKIRSLLRGAFDIREGERLRTLLVALYFVLVLLARNILSPVADAFFLNGLPTDRLAYLYLMNAVMGGTLAYFYAKIAARTSLRAAVTASAVLCVITLLIFWLLIGSGSAWVLYAFNVFVSLLALVFLSQGWLVAANVFTNREAKRLYGLLGLGAMVGGVLGGLFTAALAESLRSRNLVPLAAAFILLAAGSLHAAVSVSERSSAPQRRREVEREAACPTVRYLVGAFARHRHLSVILGITSVTFVVEVLVEFQYKSLAPSHYQGDSLTVFLGTVSVFLSLAPFGLQLMFTNAIVGRLGVGRMLLVAPLAVGAGATGVAIVPGLFTAVCARFVEASARYSINRTAIELLYLPLPAALRNRTKTFVDVGCFGRGLAATLLLLLTASGLAAPRQVSLLVLGIVGLWTLLAIYARREYLTTVRRSVESRHLDLEELRISVQNIETVRFLEQVVRGPNPGQAIYALSLLAEAPGYDPAPLLREAVESHSPVIRAKVYEIGRNASVEGLEERARQDLAECAEASNELAREAVRYLLAFSSGAPGLAAKFLNHSNPTLARAVLEAVATDREAVLSLVTHEWLETAAASVDVERRTLAAFAVGVRGDDGNQVIHRLLADPSAQVIGAACRAAGKLRNPFYFDVVVTHVANARLRGAAVEALADYGEMAVSRLGETLKKLSTPDAVRRQIPRVLARIPVQASVDELTRLMSSEDLLARAAALKALNKLRAVAPLLHHDEQLVTQWIWSEVESSYRVSAELQSLRRSPSTGKASALLTRTLETRLRETLERLFRLLALRYAPKQIYAAYLAVVHHRAEELGSALEFLENLLDHRLKRVLLPLIEGSPHLLDVGLEEFGLDVPSPDTVLRRQIGSQDHWLAACAMAAAAEQRMLSLRGEISRVASSYPPWLGHVARDAINTLA